MATTTKKTANSEKKLNEASIREMIAQAAYQKAEQRGFTPGGEEQDWLEAEKEVKTKLA